MAELVALDLDLGPGLADAVARCVSGRRAICVLDRRLSPRRREEQLRALGATRVRDESGERALEGGQPVDDDVAVVVLTSGSSGTPKAAELTWDAVRASARLTNEALRGDDPAAWWPVLPPCHIGGLAVLLRACLTDASLVWPDTDDLSVGPACGATHVAVVRAHLARFDLSAYERVLLGGAAPPQELAENTVTTWGMTETGSGVVYNRRPLPGVEIAVVSGEVFVRSPTLFRGYRSGPRPRGTGPDGRDDWFPTGDGGTFESGLLHVRGRLGFVINTGGEKVWPEDLERSLAAVDGVHDVAVTGVPDPEWGQRIVALVVGDGRDLDREIRAAARDQIGPWAQPKEIRYVTAIPRTANGKVRRGDLTHLH